ncbi:MAG: hypothetical protein ACUVS4_07515 [Chloroflexaceae bacterium]
MARQTIFPGPGDFKWALDTAWALLRGNDPYAFQPSPLQVPYPLPVALFGFPFLPISLVSRPLAAALFFGCSSGALAYAIARSGERWRLLIFATPVYFYALIFAQWSPLIVAGWFIPVLAPLLTLIKPHIALPLALNRLTRPGLLLAAVVLALSLLLDPTWPWRWQGMLGEYERIIPLLTLPSGWVLLTALLYWRDERARLLLGMAVLPFRGSYDLLALWLIPHTAWQMVTLVILSWLPLVIESQGFFAVRPAWPIPLLFIPCLIFVILHGMRQRSHTPGLFARFAPPSASSVTEPGASPEEQRRRSPRGVAVVGQPPRDAETDATIVRPETG